jgi:hypothetical protein
MDLEEYGLVINLLDKYSIDSYSDLEKLFALIINLANAYANLDGLIPEQELAELMRWWDH